MEIRINNQLKKFPQHTSITVQQVLDIEMPEKQKGIAVAVGDTVVQRSQWAKTNLTNGQELLIIKATQGG